MACMYGRCRRVVGVGVRCVWRMHGVGVWCAMAYAWRWVGVYMACVGVGVRWVCTVCRRWVYVCMTLCGERCVYVVCIVL